MASQMSSQVQGGVQPRQRSVYPQPATQSTRRTRQQIRAHPTVLARTFCDMRGRANQKSSCEQEASHSNFGPGHQSLRRNYEEREYELQVLGSFRQVAMVMAAVGIAAVPVVHAKLTRDKWMKMTKASSRTALRDIEELIAFGIIEQEEAGGRSTSYRLKKIVEQKVAMDKASQEFLKGVDRTAREDWQTQGEVVTPDFVRNVLVPKAMTLIGVRDGMITTSVECAPEILAYYGRSLTVCMMKRLKRSIDG